MLIFSGARRAVLGGVGAAATAGAVLFGAAPAATADGPNCTAADLAGVSSGVAAAASAYLFTHPDVNGYITGLKGQPRDQLRSNLQSYMDANPQVQADLQNIRQPLTDFQNRCQ